MPHAPEELPLAHRLICARVAKGLSKIELSSKMGVSQAAISSWERGESAPTKAYRESLCDALGLDRKWLNDELPADQLHDPVRGALEALPARNKHRVVK